MSDYVFAWTAYGVSFTVLFFAFLPLLFKIKWLFLRFFLIFTVLFINAAFVSFADGSDAPLLAALAVESIAGRWQVFIDHRNMLGAVFAAAGVAALICALIGKKVIAHAAEND